MNNLSPGTEEGPRSKEPVVNIYPAQVNVFQVTEEQLDVLASNDHTLWASLFSACLSAFLTVLISLITLTGTTPTQSAVLLAVVIASGVLGLAFGGLGLREWRIRSRAVAEFKNRMRQRRQP